jgi:hypothetical protein
MTKEETKEYKKKWYQDNKKRITEETKESRKINYENNKEKILETNKQWRENNKERMKELEKNWRENNKERKQLNAKIYREKNKEKLNNDSKQWAEDNKEKLKEYRKKWRENNKENRNRKEILRRQNDPLYRLKSNIRSLIGGVIRKKGYIKISKTEEILGCTFENFKKHLESQFESWMNWDNYGNWNGIPTEINIAWDIDHHIPISSGLSEGEIIKLNHYTNLKPLCSYNNRWVKSDKF